MPKYWKRLLWFGFLLGAVPAIAVGWISYSIASKGIEEKVIEGNMQVLHQTQMRTEQLLRLVELSSIQFAASPAVSEYSDQKLSVQHYEQMKELAKGLAHLQTLTGVGEARFINVEYDWLLSFRHLRPFSELPEHQEISAYRDHPKSLFWVNLSDQPTPVIRMVLKMPSIPGMPVKKMLTVDIVASEFKQQLTQSRELGDQVILGFDGTPLFASETEPPRGIQEAVIEQIRESGNKEGFFYVASEGGKRGVAYRVSPYNEWIYASIVPYEAITGQSQQIALWTWLVCLCIAVLAGCIAYFGSRRMYFPVRRLFEFARDIEEPFDQGQPSDEFTLIEKRLRVLSDHGKALQRQIRGHYSQLKEFFVMKLVMGQADGGELLRLSEMYGLPTEWRSLAVVALQLDGVKEGRIRERDRDLLLFAISNMVGELLPPHTRFSPIVFDNAQVTLVTCDEEDPGAAKRRLEAAAEMIRSKVNEYLKLEVSIGISRPFRQLRDTPKAYYESLEALKCRFRLGSNVVLHIEDIESRGDGRAADYAQLKLLEDQLVHALKMADPERTHALFGEYTSSIMKQEGSTREYTTLMLPFLSKVYQMVLEQGGSVRSVLGERAMIDYFMKLSTFDEIAAWFRNDLFAPLFAYLHKQLETTHMDISQQMIRLVQERYDEDLSLETCALILHFHPVYLSRVFKKEAGVSFTEYLTDYRMNIAKRWLEDTTYKISDIASKLRYTNTSAFIRTFRRIVGMTPGQYRERFRNMEMNTDLLPDA